MRVYKPSDIEAWFAERQDDSGLAASISEKPLQAPWLVHPESPTPIFREDGRFFSLTNVDIVNANVREVVGWSQPMLMESDAKKWRDVEVTGLILMARTTIEDGLAYLIQAKAEPGTAVKNSVGLTTSIQASFSNAKSGKVPFWKELGVDLDDEKAEAVSIIQDPGRFYRKMNLFAQKNLRPDDAEALTLPASYAWATRDAIRVLQMKGYGSEFLAQYFGSGLE